MKISSIKTQALSNQEQLTAPDESIIKELVATHAGSMILCILPPGAISQAVRHQNVEEL